MTRVKRGVSASKRRKKVLKLAKGYRWRRKSHYTAAKEALIKAGKYAYRDRRNKKRSFRSLWILRLNNAVREKGLTYSQFIKKMKEKQIALDRKILSRLAVENKKIFEKIIQEVKE